MTQDTKAVDNAKPFDNAQAAARYACVAVNVPVRPARGGTEGELVQTATFHYHIPHGMDVRPGHLVWVSFGAQQVQGVVTGLSDTTPVAETKPILSLCDERPYLTDVQLRLARWISEYYLCPLSDCVFALLPPGIEQRMLTYVTPAADAAPESTAELNADQRRVLQLVQQRGRLSVDALRTATRLRNAVAIVDQLQRRGLVRKLSSVPSPRVRPRVVRSATLVVDEATARAEIARMHEPRLRRARVLQTLLAAQRALPVAELLETAACPRQTMREMVKDGLLALADGAVSLGADPAQIEQALAAYATPPYSGRAGALALLLDQGEPIDAVELCKATGCTQEQLRSLATDGFVRIDEREERRDPLAQRTFAEARAPELTADQHRAYQAVAEELQRAAANGPLPRPVLLHGVTGSGKTEIYLRALADTLAAGRQAIIMVPEIALTPQTIQRFASRFPGRVAVLHSALSLGERFDEWRRMRDGKVDLAIGSRSAVFAPLPRLGLIVLDEEHEWTYKQSDMPPRYHAREVAIHLAELTRAVVIMGSATPDVGSYQRGLDGRYRLLSLSQRVVQAPGEPAPTGRVTVAAAPLPPVELVDMRKELREGNRSIFSRPLHRAMTAALDANEQIILFLNRRGSATFVMCRDCGHVLRCRSCDAPLGYHQAEADLVCHQCSRRVRMPERCPSCWSKRIRFFGVGTQKVEEEVQRLFPAARTLRWDRDVTQGKLAHELILDRFVRHEADVLIGTQMIAKGLDLPLVTLVGVISADTALHLPDFRAGERTFQLLTQVAGRAGRSALGGHVIVQTYTPEHAAVQAASRHDYVAFATQELAFRAGKGYPPFSALARLLLQEPNKDKAQSEAERTFEALRLRMAQLGLPDTTLAGPAPCFVSRLRGRYRWQILALAGDVHPLLEGIDLPAGWTIDVDPVTTL